MEVSPQPKVVPIINLNIFVVRCMVFKSSKNLRHEKVCSVEKCGCFQSIICTVG